MKKTDLIATIISTLGHTYGNTMLGRIGHAYTPFQVLIATVLSARARDETIELVAEELFKHYPCPKTLSKAPIATIEKLIKRSGFYHVKSRRIQELARIIHEEYGDIVPDTMEGLVGLIGVGRKTAGCVLVYSHGKAAIPVDTHVHRISNRLGLVKTRTPEKTEQALMTLVPQRQWHLVNDLFVNHGKTVCKPQRPLCRSCAIEKHCAKKIN